MDLQFLDSSWIQLLAAFCSVMIGWGSQVRLLLMAQFHTSSAASDTSMLQVCSRPSIESIGLLLFVEVTQVSKLQPLPLSSNPH